MRKTIIFGLGTTGKQTLLKLQSLLRDQISKVKQLLTKASASEAERLKRQLMHLEQNIELLVFDTNPTNGERLNEFLSGQLPDEKTVNAIRKGQLGSLSRAEFNPKALQELQGSRLGAGGIPAAGRTGYRCHRSQIEGKLKQALNRMTRDSSNLLFEDDGIVDVYIVGGGVGGTGSGSWLPLYESVLSIANQLQVQVEVLPLIVFAGSKDFVDMDNKRANSTALLFDYTAAATGKALRLEEGREPNTVEVVSRSLPPLVAVSDTNGRIHLENAELLSQLAEVLRLMASEPEMKDTFNATWVDLKRNRNEMGQDGQPKALCTMGLAELVFPRDSLRQYARNKILGNCLSIWQTAGDSPRKIASSEKAELFLERHNLRVSMGQNSLPRQLLSPTSSELGFDLSRLKNSLVQNLANRRAVNSSDAVEKAIGLSKRQVGELDATLLKRQETIIASVEQDLEQTVGNLLRDGMGGLQQVQGFLTNLLSELERAEQAFTLQQNSLNERYAQAKNEREAAAHDCHFSHKRQRAIDRLKKAAQTQVITDAELKGYDAAITVLCQLQHKTRTQLNQVEKASENLRHLLQSVQAEAREIGTDELVSNRLSWRIPLLVRHDYDQFLKDFGFLERERQQAVELYRQLSENNDLLELFSNMDKLKVRLCEAIEPSLNALDRLNVDDVVENLHSIPQRQGQELAQLADAASKEYFPLTQLARLTGQDQHVFRLCASPKGKDSTFLKTLNSYATSRGSAYEPIRTNNPDRLYIWQFGYRLSLSDWQYAEAGMEATSTVIERAGFGKPLTELAWYRWFAVRSPELRAKLMAFTAWSQGYLDYLQADQLRISSKLDDTSLLLNPNLPVNVLEDRNAFLLEVELTSLYFVSFQLRGRTPVEEVLSDLEASDGNSSDPIELILVSLCDQELLTFVRKELDFWEANTLPFPWKDCHVKFPSHNAEDLTFLESAINQNTVDGRLAM